MLTLKLTKIGSSIGFIVPEEALSKLHLNTDSIVYLTEAPDGYHLTFYRTEFEHQMRLAEKVMAKDRELLRQLA